MSTAARAILIECLETPLEIGRRVLALLAIAHKLAELVEIELAVTVIVRRVTLHCIVAHRHLHVLLSSARDVVRIGLKLSSERAPGAVPALPIGTSCACEPLGVTKRGDEPEASRRGRLGPFVISL